MSHDPMSEFDQPGGQPVPAYPERKRGWGCGGCLLGCFVVFLILLVIIGLGVWYLVHNAPDLIRSAAAEIVKQSELSPEDQAAVMKQVDRVTEEYKAGRISLDQLGRIVEELSRSPLVPLMMVYAADEKYLKPSGLANEEKDAGRIAVRRVAHGAFAKKIDNDELQRLLTHISTRKPDGEIELKERVTDDELRAFIAACDMSADAAGIEETPPDVEIAEELKRAIDQVLQP